MKEESKIVKIHNFLQISGQTDHTDFKHQPTANLHTKSQKKKKKLQDQLKLMRCTLSQNTILITINTKLQKSSQEQSWSGTVSP